MKLEKLMASAVGAAAMIVIATAPAALAKGKQTQSFSVGCLTQDTGVDVSLQLIDITDDQLVADNGNGGGCGKPTSTQGADWAPTVFPGVAATGTLQLTSDSLALDGVQVRSERCAKLGTRTYTITVACCDTTNAVCDTVGTVNAITLGSLPTLDVTVAKSKKH